MREHANANVKKKREVADLKNGMFLNTSAGHDNRRYFQLYQSGGL